jgi:hypothetical protein
MLAEPDVLQALHGAAVYLEPENPAGIHLRGGSSDQTLYLLDDIPVFNPFHAAGVFGAWNPDAIADVEIRSAAAPAAAPDALSGVISARTRAARLRHSMQGTISTTQARAVVDGPIGQHGGYLLAGRSGFHDVFAPRDEPSYLNAETGDWLGKLTFPVLGGELSALAYEAENEVDVAAVANSQVGDRRNTFEWISQSVGARWAVPIRGSEAAFMAWSARARVAGAWQRQLLHSSLREVGFSATLRAAQLELGARLISSHSSYRADSASLPGTAIITSLFAERTVQPTRSVQLQGGLAVTHALGKLHSTPRLRLSWQPVAPLTLLASYARTQKFTQSLRNHESLVSSIFPAELPAVADGHVIPVAKGDQLVLGAEFKPSSGARLVGQFYTRRFHHLALAAPRTAGPFSVGGLVGGRGAASGMAVDAAFNSSGFGVIASYGWQHVRLRFDTTSFEPHHAVAHSLEAGVIAFPGNTWSVKLGATGVLGRRATPVVGSLEWESCNLLDRGCEFGGEPVTDPGALGSGALPWYARVDLGVRKHWHPAMAGRTASVALFATVTNLFGRRNVLGYTQADGSGHVIGMRPRSVLLAGLDWSW